MRAEHARLHAARVCRDVLEHAAAARRVNEPGGVGHELGDEAEARERRKGDEATKPPTFICARRSTSCTGCRSKHSSCCRSCAKLKSRAASNISGGVGVWPLPPRERRAPPLPGGGGDPSCCRSSGAKTLVRGMARCTFQRTPKSSKPEIGTASAPGRPTTAVRPATLLVARSTRSVHLGRTAPAFTFSHHKRF